MVDHAWISKLLRNSAFTWRARELWCWFKGDLFRPCRWAPTWRLHTILYKFGENGSPYIFHKKNCCDLNLGESLCISTFFLFPDSGLNLLNGFDFLFWSILNGVTLKTSNRACCWITALNWTDETRKRFQLAWPPRSNNVSVLLPDVFLFVCLFVCLFYMVSKLHI